MVGAKFKLKVTVDYQSTNSEKKRRVNQMLTAVTLTAVSRKVETKKGKKKVDFFRLFIKRRKAEKTREIFLSRFFVISEI